jgi:hypothetical protein
MNEKRGTTLPRPMRDPVLASRVFGVYLVAAGAFLFLVPGISLPLLGLAVPSEVWVRVVGLLTGILGMYFLYCARADQRRFFQATVIARLIFCSGVVALVLAGLAPPLLALFGVVDILGATWTQVALRGSGATR